MNDKTVIEYLRLPNGGITTKNNKVADYIEQRFKQIRQLEKEAQQSHDRERVLREAFNSLIDLCKYEANFKNGNTWDGCDEGDVLAWRLINQLKERCTGEGNNNA